MKAFGGTYTKQQALSLLRGRGRDEAARRMRDALIGRLAEPAPEEAPAPPWF